MSLTQELTDTIIIRKEKNMKSIIEKIYYGDLRPCEESAPPTERYIKNRKDICAVEDQLLKRCTDCEELKI